MKVIVTNHVTLDGVMQAPMGADEDRRGGFEHGGWAAANASGDGTSGQRAVDTRKSRIISSRKHRGQRAHYRGSRALPIPIPSDRRHHGRRQDGVDRR